MKILKISLKNINSLRGEHHIDFETAPLKDNSLFAITGPTGSGKSTILDVISLALFTIVPRLGRITKNTINDTGAVLTKNQQDAYASITYSCTKGIFQSTWSISTARTGSLRDYEMQLKNVVSGKELPLKKSEVPAKNEAFIGLNYEQFIKSVVLAQGEFAQFLKVPKKERSELLEKITGTGIYRQLGARAFEKNKQASELIKSEETNINYEKNNLIEDEIFEQIQKDLKKLKVEKEATLKELEKLKADQTVLKEITGKNEEIAFAKAKQTLQLKEQADFFQQNGSKLDAHEKTQTISEKLRTWEELRKIITQKTKVLAELKTEKEQLVQEENNLSRTTATFLGAEIKKQDAAESLETFRDKVSDLIQKREALRSKHNELKAQLNGELRPLDLDKNPSIDLLEIKLAALKLDLKRRKEELIPIVPSSDIDQLKKHEPRLEKEIDQLQKAIRLNDRIEPLKTESSSLLEKIKIATDKQKSFPEHLKILSDKHLLESKDEKVLQLQQENHLLSASLEDLRNKLVEQHPCPLCGSVHHPYAKDLQSSDDEMESKINDNKRALRTLETAITQTSAESKSVNESLIELNEKKSKIDNEFEKIKFLFTSDYEGLPMDSEELEKQAVISKEKLVALKLYIDIQARLNALVAAEKLVPHMQATIIDGNKITTELEKIYKGDNLNRDVNSIKTNWSKLQSQESSIKRAENTQNVELDDSQKQLSNLTNDLNAALISLEFKSIEDAALARLPDNIYLNLNKERGRLNTGIESQKSTLQTLAAQLEKLLEKNPEESLESIEEKLVVISSRLEQLDLLVNNSERKTKNQLESLKRIEDLKEKIEKHSAHVKRWRVLNELIGDSTGNKFNDFAQDLTLSRLLLFANKRMEQLSDRYTIDKSMPDEDDSLIAIDDHMGGQRRSVKTLSGGETFVMSLALALALSDLASKKVRIESMFIDEGFGTLDPETLDQTMDTLEKLQTESGKTIGVISHVESLKERIQTQVVLRRDSHGYSTLEVK
ncbi:AAA family ATPase [Nonlabens antarcticus]|uniref:AAA family ATPase n=1 Tax=Nonlabens antarcticus TaxID=392714 RepID=UPI0018917023|nr:AAA family ATPase [Nonlabens antarcticus]